MSKCGESDGAGADDGDGRAGLDLAVEHAAFEAGRQDIAQHDKRIFVRARWNVIETGIGEGNANKFRLGAVDLVAENPAAIDAMRVHATTAIVAFSAGRDARHDYAIAGVKRGDCRADLVDHADAFVTENAAGRAGRHVTLEDMQVGAADRGLDDFDDGIRRRGDLRLRTILDGFLAGSIVDEGLHGILLDLEKFAFAGLIRGRRFNQKILLSIQRLEC